MKLDDVWVMQFRVDLELGPELDVELASYPLVNRSTPHLFLHLLVVHVCRDRL